MLAASVVRTAGVHRCVLTQSRRNTSILRGGQRIHGKAPPNLSNGEKGGLGHTGVGPARGVRTKGRKEQKRKKKKERKKSKKVILVSGREKGEDAAFFFFFYTIARKSKDRGNNARLRYICVLMQTCLFLVAPLLRYNIIQILNGQRFDSLMFLLEKREAPKKIK